ncbi:hypothetical protein BD310DRAFT_280660 [Dichomitus squalens]|uniref:Uncharacterized protein n=1 Tax=Dichomitus squalens TaxID=114155 RepID=A0A4Q9QAH4_9APHY|nr:hypothetical protein BD310DRAFT_280660 [Dichomitus squalens]
MGRRPAWMSLFGSWNHMGYVRLAADASRKPPHRTSGSSISVKVCPATEGLDLARLCPRHGTGCPRIRCGG